MPRLILFFKNYLVYCILDGATKLIILSFQTDKPVPPGSVGARLFLSGITDVMRQEARDRLFSVTKEQMVDVTNRFVKAVITIS